MSNNNTSIVEVEDAVVTRLCAEPVQAPAALPYGGDPDQVYERYGESGPVIVVVHGGFFRPTIDRTHARPQAAALARAGFRVLLPEYRRVPGDPMRTADDLERFDEVAAGDAMVWVGHSAGGALVLWRAAATHRRPVRALALAPVCDLARAHTERLGDGAVTAWMGGSPAQQPQRYAALDPKRVVTGDVVPRIALHHGADDGSVPADYSRDFLDPTVHGTARQQNIRGRVRIVAGAHHTDLIDPSSPFFAQVVQRVRELSA